MADRIMLDIRKRQITKLTGWENVSDEIAARFDGLLEAYGEAKWDFGDRLYTSFGEGIYTFHVTVTMPWRDRCGITVHPHPDLDSRWVEESMDVSGTKEPFIEARKIIEGWLAKILTNPDTETMAWAQQRGPIPDHVAPRKSDWEVTIDKVAGEITFGMPKP